MQKVLCLAILVCLTSTAQSGWVVKQTQQGPWGNSEETHLFQGNKLATKGEWLRIIDLSSGTVSLAIPDKNIFWSGPADEYLALLKKAGMSGGEMTGQDCGMTATAGGCLVQGNLRFVRQ